ncbi:MAG: sigma 54-interacting transcriptional regulator [Desulfobacterales bacterium]|nr:sigma 54-interacting transcriptional regulator [Desulfobacterales bacterium]
MTTEMNGKKGSILIVDDELPSLETISSLLKAEGYDVRGAIDGETGMMIIESDPPDLILLDVRMPGMDGYEFCRQVKRKETINKIPILFMSVLDQTSDIIKGFEAGSVDYIPKPFHAEEVLARVNTHITLGFLRQNLELAVEKRTKSLKSSVELLKLFSDKNPNGIYIKDGQKRHLYFNHALGEIADIQATDFIGTTAHHLFPKEIAETLEKYDQMVLDGQAVVEVPEVEFEIDGTPRSFKEVKFGFFGPQGVPHVGGIVTETTQEKELQSRLDMVSHSLENATVTVVFAGPEGDILYANKAAYQTAGLTYEEMQGKRVWEIDQEFTEDSWSAHFQEMKKKKYMQLERTHVAKDGEIKAVEVTCNYFETKSNEYIFAYGKDISIRKHKEKQLKESLEQIQKLKQRLEQENTYLRKKHQMIESPTIIGDSEPIESMMELAQKVAPTDSTVLILGETGTGKELLASTIHELSPRKDNMMIRINCASFPATLIESELFGSAKGAFTGAATEKKGCFEAADESTLLLDEIGELPLEAQAKLLRILQDGQLKRLGDHRTRTVNVRVLASTNRDLREMVTKGNFRKDLFYRLNIFPITAPPLRDHMEDIPQLVWTFTGMFGELMGKTIESIPEETMSILKNYTWPGNVRELKNVIERAMILTSGKILEPKTVTIGQSESVKPLRLEDAQKDHILSVLNMTGWRIQGKGGAAEILDLNPSTLRSRMDKLGIERPVQTPD